MKPNRREEIMIEAVACLSVAGIIGVVLFLIFN